MEEIIILAIFRSSEVQKKEQQFSGQSDLGFQSTALPVLNCMALRKLLNLSEPHYRTVITQAGSV